MTPAASLPGTRLPIVERLLADRLLNPDYSTRIKAAVLIEELVGALDQLLDDMGEDGLCVCQQAKDEATVILAKARQ